MGILQSVLQFLVFETDEEESGISTMNSYNFSSHDLACSPTRSYQIEYLTVSVPDLRASSSHTYTTVNDNCRVKNSAGYSKENVPPNGCRGGGRRRRDEIPVVVKGLAAAPEGRWIKHYSSCDLRGIDDEKAHIVESDHDMVVSVAEISNQEIVEEVPSTNLSSLDESVGLLNSREEEEEEEVEEEEVQIKSIVAVFEKRKIKHYNNQHKILLVGEGDFSFSACLAVAFGSATNIIATSLNSKAFLEMNYGSALSNIAELRRRGSKVMHGVDATKIGSHKLLAHLKFDRIVFNFPFAGFFRKLSPESRLRRHRRLVRRFVKNAKEMMGENGEIHISHKTNGFHAEFNLESIASSQGLRLIAAVKFKCENYPGYNTKYGFGGDANFNCYPSKTFKFGLKL